MTTAFLTPEQDAEFDGYMRKWQTLLGLNDWRVERGPKRASKDNMATVSVRQGARLAVYKTGGWSTVTSRELEATAVHELLHVFLSDLKHAVEKEADDVTLESVEHAVINRLEKLLLKDAG